MEWVYKEFEQLSKNELYQLLQLRVNVFVVEQECPYPEIDGRDQESLHVWAEEAGEMIAYCRIVPSLEAEGHYSIGRVIVSKQNRGSGLGRELMNRAIDVLKNDWKVSAIELHGQEHLRTFYGSFGFKEVSDVYLEDNIPHVDMVMTIE